MNAPKPSGSPREVVIHVDRLFNLPVNDLMERIPGAFVPGSPGATSMALILRTLSNQLLSEPPRADKTKRAVAFLEMADALDGLGPKPKKGGL